jgi:hypothetical protein
MSLKKPDQPVHKIHSEEPVWVQVSRRRRSPHPSGLRSPHTARICPARVVVPSPTRPWLHRENCQSRPAPTVPTVATTLRRTRTCQQLSHTRTSASDTHHDCRAPNATRCFVSTRTLFSMISILLPSSKGNCIKPVTVQTFVHALYWLSTPNPFAIPHQKIGCDLFV